jgi:hypothetical protein
MSALLHCLWAIPVLALATNARAQSLLEWQGVSPNQRLGSVAAVVPDTDGDGVEDVLLSSPFLAFAGFQSGAVALHSGASGSELLIVGGDAPGDHAGWSAIGLSDLDGDGRGDFAVGAPEADGPFEGSGRVRVHSGASGAVLFQWQGKLPYDGLGGSLASAGDVDGDGTVDLLVGAWRASAQQGRVEVRSGASGALLRQHLGATPEERLGWSLCGLGDVDGDGRDDYALGATQEGIGPGFVRVHSGASGALLHELVGRASFEAFGSALCSLGDVDGDGRGDLAIGAVQAQSFDVERGRVDVHSGASAALVWSREGSGELGQYGFALAGGRDLDGDGTPDLVAGGIFGGGWRGRVSVHAGASGLTLQQWIGNGVSDRFGWSVAVIEDLDGDGRPDVLVGAPRQDVNVGDEGSARVLSSAGGCATFQYCETKVSAAGCLPAIGSAGSSALSGAGDLRVHARELPAGSIGLFLFSLSPAGTPLGSGTLCVLPPLVRSLPADTGGPAAEPCSGRLALALPPADLLARGWQAGDLLHVQAWCRDPGHPDGTAASVSDALGVLLCP